MRRLPSVAVLLIVFFSSLPLALAATYYIDCSAGSDKAAGTSVATAWGTLNKVAATTFAPGDSILFKRATRCTGQLSPKGSGDPERPIRIGAYGNGPLPVISAGDSDAAIK